MSANIHDAFPEFPGQLLKIDVPVPVGPDPTEDLADEVTSELAPAPRWTRPLPAPEPVAVPGADEVAGPASAENVLRDRYVLETEIGNGGTATVWRAVDLRRDAADADGRRVAIKLLRPEMRSRATCIARLQREFRQTQAVVHPNVVRFFDIDCDRGSWFIVMEHLSGETLGAVLRRDAPAGLAHPEAIRIACAVGDALAHAHACGIIHGDVKPANVFMTASGGPRLLDFGVAPESAQRTDEGGPAPVAPAATRVYASPEVLAGEDPEPRDDVFSLACVTYEMLAGVHPYGRHGADAALREGLAPQPVAGLDDARWAVLAAALDPLRAVRPAMADFERALRDGPVAKPPAPILAPVAPAQPPPAAQASPRVAPAPVAVPVPRRARLTWLAAIAAGLALLLGILIGRFNTLAEDPVPHAPAPRLDAVPPPPPVATAVAVVVPVPTATESAKSRVEAAVPVGPPGMVFFDVPRMDVSKRAVVAAIPMRHLSRVKRAVNVNWRLIEGTARPGRDYGGPESGVESFVEGNSFRILYVPILANPGSPRDREFTVEMTAASPGAELGPTPRIEITILGES
jgi:serine/threonine protein kinase